MKPFINIESDYSKRVSLEHRKKFAQFFTPPKIAELMICWLIQNNDIKTVLEPAFGLGVFSRLLLLHNNDISIKGFEIDAIIYDEAKKQFDDHVQLLLQDYMYNDWNNTYDGIICNPPYFKFHDYDNKSIIKEIEKRLSCKLNGFTNLYTLFLLKSIHQLNSNGRCAYIVPSEFMNSDYGKLVKYHLIKTKTLRYIIVFDFEENVFDDALTTACIILCAKDDKTDVVQFSNIASLDDIDSIKTLITSYPNLSKKSKKYKFDELNPEIKWKNYYQEQTKSKYKNLVPFSTYAKVVRGIATGANDYFTFNLSKANKFNIDEKYLLPCICRCADVKKPIFSKIDFESLKNDDKKVFLFNAVDNKNAAVSNYLKQGEEDGVADKYLTSSRNPWFAIEKRAPAPIWVSVFNRKGLRFVRNEASVSNLTTFHCVYPQISLFSDITVDLLFSYLITDTAKSIFEDNAREYGNGLKKFEPNDLNNAMMIDLKQLSEEQKQKILSYYKKFKKTNDNKWIQMIDNLLQNRFLTSPQ